ncbi:MAG: SusC/RagA family TonB-linked outer membrane protein [Niabella sp.]
MRFALFSTLLLVFGILFASVAWAQTSIYTGIVLDETNGTALIGATVTNKESTATSITDSNGSFSITAGEGNVLEITYTGYTTQQITLGRQLKLSIVLSTGVASKLEEVVVVGYGTQKRSKLTGSVSKLDNKIMETGIRSNPAQALAGTIPGLRVITGTGRPGSIPAIILRGGTNFDGTGSPLYLIDGQVRESLSDINPEEIESMEVLKDASATAIYGARASNGVVLVTTKRGKVGSSSINLKARWGHNYLNIPYNFLSAEDYLKWARLGVVQAIINGQRTAAELNNVGARGTGNMYFAPGTTTPLDGNYDSRARWSTMRLTEENRFLLNEGWKTMKDPVPTNTAGHYDPNGTYADLLFQEFNFREAAFKSPAPSHDYNIGFTGGNEKGKYYANIGQYNEDGLSLNTFYKRINLALNADYQIKPWLKSESGFQFAKANWRDNSLLSSEDGYWGRMLSAPPTLRERSPITNELILGRDANDGNPLVNANKFIRKNQTDKFTMNQALTVFLWEGLNVRFNGILYYDEGHEESFNKDYRTGFLSYTNPNAGWNRDRASSASFDRTIRQTYNAVVNYKKETGLHYFDAMAGAEYYDAYTKGLSAGGRLAPTDDFMDLGLTKNTSTDFTRSTDSWHSRERIISQFGRVNYDFDDKYLASFTLRRDGVSRLATQTRYGVFPAASLGWMVSRESFMGNTSDWLNYLKLRASWGKNGNIGIGTSNAIGIYEVQGAYGSLTPYNGVTGFLLTSLANPTLQWEKSTTTEFGFDMGLFKNAIYLSAAYYNRVTTDKLAFVTLPVSSGISSNRTNNGSLRNRGIEMDITANIIRKTDFKWSVSANAAWNKNIVLKLPFNGNENNRQGGQRVYDPASGQIIWVGGLQEGQEWGTVYGFVSDGIIRNAEDLANYNKIDEAAGVAYDLGNAAGRKVASQKLITERGLTGFISTQLGDMKWRDLDKNDTIDYRDMAPLGRTLPRWTGGFNTSLSYKGISLFMRLDFGFGHVQRDFMQGWSLGAMQGEFNPTNIVMDTWTADNPGAKYPRYTWADQLNTKNFDRPSTLFWVNSSYLAFREVSLSYSVPKSLLQKVRITGLTLTATGQNLGYLTNKMLKLPERTGAQRSAYTIPTILVFGANLSF